MRRERATERPGDMLNYEEIEVFRRSFQKNEAPKLKVKFEEDYKSLKVVKKSSSPEKRDKRDKRESYRKSRHSSRRTERRTHD